MQTDGKIEALSDAEIFEVTGGLFGVGIITTPVDPGAISGGVAGWLLGEIPGANFDGGTFGYAAEHGSLLLLHSQISQALYFSILRQ